jgi:hypothetical protein
MKRIQSASTRLLLPALAFATLAGHAWPATPIITETPDCYIVELTGQAPPTRETLPPAPKVEPYLVERIIEHPDYFEVEIIGVPPSTSSQQAAPTRPAPSYSAPAAAPPPREVAVSQPQPVAPPKRPEQEVTSSSAYQGQVDQLKSMQKDLAELQTGPSYESKEDQQQRRQKLNEKLKEIRGVTTGLRQMKTEAAGR